MRFTSSFRNISLSLATAAFLLTGSALAQQAQQSSAGQQTYRLVGVNAKLDHALSSKKAKPGDPVEAKLQDSAKTSEGVDLPKGTELCGKVLQAQSSENNTPARVSVLFNQAKLQDGKTIPVHVILLAAYPPITPMATSYGSQMMGPAPKTVAPDEKVNQEPGLLHNIAMHSDMHGNDSASFIDDHGDFTLRAGTRFQIGIAPARNAATSSGM